MSYKRIIGIVLVVIGLAMIVYGAYSMKSIEQAKCEVQEFVRPYAGNPSKIHERKMVQNTHKYDPTIMYVLIGGVVITLVGSGLTIFSRKR